MDIGKIIEIGTREIPTYKPAPTMVPVRQDPPERAPQREPVTTPEKEKEPA